MSDSGNNRIQKLGPQSDVSMLESILESILSVSSRWLPGATEGVTVAGGNGKGSRFALKSLHADVSACAAHAEAGGIARRLGSAAAPRGPPHH